MVFQDFCFKSDEKCIIVLVSLPRLAIFALMQSVLVCIIMYWKSEFMNFELW